MSSIKDLPESSYLMSEQMQSPQYRGLRSQRRPAFLVVAVLLIIGGAIAWILNIVGIIPGSWSGIFGASFTVLGVVLGLLPMFSSSPQKVPAQSTTPSVTRQRHSNQHVPLEGVILSLDDQRGALIVYVKKYLRGSTINLCCGFSSVDLKIDAAASVVRRRKHDRVSPLLRMLGLPQDAFVAVFPALEPGNYTVYSESREFVTRVGIHAGQVIEVDWQ